MAAAPDLSPRAARTRAALIGAGFDLLVDRPIDAIPIDEVVARAGVAKGSFFNHFADKSAFAAAISREVRLELEALVSAANDGVTDPVERIAGGMRTGWAFALREPRRTAVLLRGTESWTASAHPLNRGLRADVEAALEAGALRPQAAEAGVLYWLGLCQVLMTSMVEAPDTPAGARARLEAIMVMGLTGLGVADDRAEAIARL